MEITPEIKIIDLALLVNKNLIICDTHIGYEEAMNQKGILMPRFQFKEIMKRLEKILKKAGKLDKIIINGDLTHEFGKILDQEWRDTLKLLDFLSKYGKIIFIKGNHDTYIKPIADKRNVKVKDQIVLDKHILVIHGDKIPKIDKKIDTIIIGHEHPAISLKEGAQIELYKCYLVGKYKRKMLIVQPSFNQVKEGTDVLEGDRWSPLLSKNINNFRIFVVEDKVYDFGKIKDLPI